MRDFICGIAIFPFFKQVGKYTVDYEPRPWLCWIFFGKWKYRDIGFDEQPRPIFNSFAKWLEKKTEDL